MKNYQKTIVRYELNPRAAENADFWEKWQYPCFLGADDNGELKWFECTFEDLISQKKLHNIFYFEHHDIPENDFSEEARTARLNERLNYETWVKNTVLNLTTQGLIVKSEEVEFMSRKETRVYKYVFEGYRFERLIAKEILGIDVENNQEMTQEQFDALATSQDKIWAAFQKLCCEQNNDLIDFSNMF